MIFEDKVSLRYNSECYFLVHQRKLPVVHKDGTITESNMGELGVTEVNLYNRTPMTFAHFSGAMRQLKEYGVDVSPDLEDKIKMEGYIRTAKTAKKASDALKARGGF